MDDAPTPAPRYWPRGPVILAPPHAGWAADAAAASAALVHALAGLPLAVHHIGSTAVPGLLAKPVLDLLAVVPALDALDARAPRIVALGYEALGEFGIPGRRYFRKNAPDGARTHQLHAFAAGSPEIARHVAFRDYLRAHPASAAEYAALKRALAAQHGADSGAYTDGKTAFIRAVEQRAAAWRRDGARLNSRGDG